MIDDVLAPGGGPEGRRVVEIALDQPHPASPERGRLGGRAHQRGDRVAGLEQGLEQVAPDEPGAPGHQGVHNPRSNSRYRL